MAKKKGSNKKNIPKRSVSKKTTSPSKKRRSQKVIGAELRHDRKPLYSKRYYYRKKLDQLAEISTKDLSPKEKRDLGKKIVDARKKLSQANSKINKINIRLVKYTKRWDNFKKNKRKIRSKINSLKSEIRKGGLSEKQTNKLLQEIRDYSEQIKLLEGKQYEKYRGEFMIQKGKVDFISTEDGNYVEEIIVIWELKGKVTDAISTERFDTINISGEILSTQDLGAIIMELDMFIADIADKQFKTATPMVRLVYDFTNRMILVTDITTAR